MEYCNAGSLLDTLNDSRFYDMASMAPKLHRFLPLLKHVAMGCAYLHGKRGIVRGVVQVPTPQPPATNRQGPPAAGKKIIHGDLKPDNVLLQRTSAAGSGRRAVLVAKVRENRLTSRLLGLSGTSPLAGTLITGVHSEERQASRLLLGLSWPSVLTRALLTRGSLRRLLTLG
jgi:serine/threonine protein kinase